MTDSLSSVRAAKGLEMADNAARPGKLVLGLLIGLSCLPIVVLYVSWNPEQSGGITGAGHVAMSIGGPRGHEAPR